MGERWIAVRGDFHILRRINAHSNGHAADINSSRTVFYLQGNDSIFEYNHVHNNVYGAVKFYNAAGAMLRNIIRFNYVHDNGGFGRRPEDQPMTMHDNIVANNGGRGVWAIDSGFVYNNIIYGTTAADGVPAIASRRCSAP